MVAAQPRAITLDEIEILSFLKQNIIRKICEEAVKQGHPRSDPQVIQVLYIFTMTTP